MLSEAQNCDLLLMRGSRSMANIVRGVTKSHFDHIAIVVRTEDDGPNDFTIVESVNGVGVSS
jgi:hypothetical protein